MDMIELSFSIESNSCSIKPIKRNFVLECSINMFINLLVIVHWKI